MQAPSLVPREQARTPALVRWYGCTYKVVAGPSVAGGVQCWVAVECGRHGRERGAGSKLCAIPCGEAEDVSEGKAGANKAGVTAAEVDAASNCRANVRDLRGAQLGALTSARHLEHTSPVVPSAVSTAAPVTYAAVSRRLRRALGCSPAFILTLGALLALLSLLFD